MICGYTLLPGVSKSVVAHPGCQMVSSWRRVWSDKICRSPGGKKAVARRYWVRVTDTWRTERETERESERISLTVWGVFGFGLLNDATSSQASQEEEFSPSFFALFGPLLSFYYHAFLLMTFNSPTSLCLSPLSNAMEHREMGFIYLWSCIVCMRGLKKHSSELCCHITKPDSFSCAKGETGACWSPFVGSVHVVGGLQNAPSLELQRTQQRLAILHPLL